MQVVDIVNEAAEACGLASSFNGDEVPEDIQIRGAKCLRNEIIPLINTDRTLDITEVCVERSPENSFISLSTTPDDYPNVVYGITPYHSDYIMKVEKKTGFPTIDDEYEVLSNLELVLLEMGLVTDEKSSPFTMNITDKWARDPFGKPYNIAIWSSDYRLIEIKPDGQLSPESTKVNRIYNIPFYPSGITAVLRQADGAEYQFLYPEERLSAQYRYNELVYSIEEYTNKLIIRFNDNVSAGPVTLVLPCPLKIINTLDQPEPWSGTIIAPQKFRPYLVAVLAERLAGENDLSTLPAMKELVKKAYQGILKAKGRKAHGQNISKKIRNYLKPVKGAVGGTTGGVYGGGFYG